MSPLNDQVDIWSDDDEEEDRLCFTESGSIVRIKFVNFMQYSETEFKCGPNLNVIIGPNGSGKSSIVNGICLGLAGKTNLLGRSTNVQDFIRVGETEASIEIELFSAEGRNVIIRRSFDMSGSSSWTVDGKKCGVREVERKVAEFRIQVDNLCQFLPQDKVHDFSKLSSKGLLDSTVDAVGDQELKNNHNELKELQRTIVEGEDLTERKKQMLDEKTEQCRRLEEDVKVFKEKKQMESSIALAEGKLTWCKFYEKRRNTKEINDRFVSATKRLQEESERLRPIEESIKEVETKKMSLERKFQTLTRTSKDFLRAAQTQSRKIEELEEALNDADDDLENMEINEDQRKSDMRRIQTTIAELEAEYHSIEDDQSLQPQLEEARQKCRALQEGQEADSAQIENIKYEQSKLTAELEHRQAELIRLNDTEKMKLRRLQQLSDDAYRAVLWLRENTGIFKHQVFEPFLLCANVNSPSDSKYLENTINARDFSAFFFEDCQDMNLFLKIVREQKGLKKVSAVQLPSKQLSEYKAPRRTEDLRRFGFISYLTDLVTAPDSVLSFMCQQYGLHRVPVFSAEADKAQDAIVKMGFTKFFIGPKMHSVSGSLYSSVISTMTREILSKGMLEISKDCEKEKLLKSEILEIESNLLNLTKRIESFKGKVQSLSIELEKSRKHQKELEQKRHLKLRHEVKIKTQKTLLDQKMSEVGSEREREKIKTRKRSLVMQLVSVSQELSASIARANDVGNRIEATRLAIQPLDGVIEIRTKTLQDARNHLKEFEREKQELEKEVMEAKEDLKLQLRKAIRATGHNERKKDEPPAAVKASWESANIPDTSEEIEIFRTELEAKADCMDSVDQAVVEEYTELKLVIRELETDLKRREDMINSKSNKLDHLKQSWLQGLTSLVEQINTNFSSYFADLGFAGEVGLSAGQHENDFDNYGVNIRVKFRDSEPLQELTAHRQSGGERSVATALYMLALQELTTVPFRCVDEINQGMDATNERRVFELLVRTSCYRSSSQYFLLTPKLLPGLAYSPRMNLLIVYNGQNMCQSHHWNNQMERHQ